MKGSTQFRSLPGVWAFIGLLAINATLAAPAAAQDLVLEDGGVHNISPTITGTLVIRNNTTVNLTGGSIGASGNNSVIIRDTSVFTMSGGKTTGGRIAAVGNSVVTLNGGTLGFDPSPAHDSIVTFGNATIEVFNINASGKATAVGGTITIHGGSFSAAATFGTGAMEILGGSFDGSVNGLDSSTIILRGGAIGADNFGASVVGFGLAAIEVRGGAVSGRILSIGSSDVDVFGCPLSLDGSGRLTGLLEDGTPISVNTSGPINVFTCTPKDATSALASFVESLDLALFDGANDNVRGGALTCPQDIALVAVTSIGDGYAMRLLEGSQVGVH